MRRMVSRRAFLRTAAGAALFSSGCGSDQPRSPGRTAKTTPHATVPADWNALGRGLQGRLIRPGEADYDDARRLFVPRFDDVRPAGIAYCAGAQDVQECVLFARRTGVPLAIRCGGHGYAGWSTGPGLVVDVSAMNAISVQSGRAVVGAGARIADVYDRLAVDGVSVPAGSCPSVGMAGQTLGGGLGVVARKYGLTCDVMESVRIVTADGRLLACDARQDPDLYWACRGGGGGNFGVAVEFTLRTHPAPDVTIFFYRWPWSSGRAVMTAWQDWIARLPDELWSTLHLDNGESLQVGGLLLGDPGTCTTLVERLVAGVGEPSSRFLRQVTYRHAMDVMGGCASYGQAQCHRQGTLAGRTPEGLLAREDFIAKSHMVGRPLPTEGVQALLNRFGSGSGRSMLLDSLGGAVGRIAPDATAFPHRSALFSVQYVAAPGDRAWLRGVHDLMSRYAGTTAYVNYLDPELPDWRRAYYGANDERLRKVKAAYDPDGLFRFPQAV